MTRQANNPFSSPTHYPQSSPDANTDNTVIDFRDLARKWEWYRLIYNGLLATWTIVVGFALFGLGFVDLVVVAFVGGVAANFFFLLGPAIDGYFQWLFRSRSKIFGVAILILGTLFTMSLAVSLFWEMLTTDQQVFG
jgi:hypothetical protein